MKKVQYAVARHLYLLWKGFQRMLRSADTKLTVLRRRIAILEKFLLTVDSDDYVLVVTDSESRILASIDRTGKWRLPVGVISGDSLTDGDNQVNGVFRLRGTQLKESDDYGLFYVLDSEDHILLTIDLDGNVDFKGVPRDIKSRIEELENRLSELEEK